jgi:adenosylcobinamide-GDP ribazoletransferase
MSTDDNDSNQTVSAKLAFLTAVQFLTRVPVSGAMGASADEYQRALKASVVYFPLVGFLIGLYTTVLYGTGLWLWSPLVAALIAIAGEAYLTGAFHEDALADATDALGGGWTREQVLEILKDSRHGTYGVLALVIGVMLRVALISNLDWPMALIAIPFSSGIGRWSILMMMRNLEPITDRHTMSRDVGSRPSNEVLIRGAAFLAAGYVATMVWLSLFGPTVSITKMLSQVIFGYSLAIGASLAMTWYFTRVVRQRVGGVTGDFLGCNCYLVQLVSLLAMHAAH